MAGAVLVLIHRTGGLRLTRKCYSLGTRGQCRKMGLRASLLHPAPKVGASWPFCFTPFVSPKQFQLCKALMSTDSARRDHSPQEAQAVASSALLHSHRQTVLSVKASSLPLPPVSTPCPGSPGPLQAPSPQSGCPWGRDPPPRLEQPPLKLGELHQAPRPPSRTARWAFSCCRIDIIFLLGHRTVRCLASGTFTSAFPCLLAGVPFHASGQASRSFTVAFPGPSSNQSQDILICGF